MGSKCAGFEHACMHLAFSREISPQACGKGFRLSEGNHPQKARLHNHIVVRKCVHALLFYQKIYPHFLFSVRRAPDDFFIPLNCSVGPMKTRVFCPRGSLRTCMCNAGFACAYSKTRQNGQKFPARGEPIRPLFVARVEGQSAPVSAF